MKTLPILAALLLAPTLLWAAPQIGAEQAAKLAQANLKERGIAGQVFIRSITLEGDSQGSGGYWTVKWSGEIPMENDKKETGLQIDRDGGLARLVKGPSNRDPVTGQFDPNGSTGLGNHRTRSDRPSILDLKH